MIDGLDGVADTVQAAVEGRRFRRGGLRTACIVMLVTMLPIVIVLLLYAVWTGG